MTPTSILVTGADGYLGGRVLLELRAQGVDVVGVGSSSRGKGGCDLTNLRQVEALLRRTAAKVVVHCAARVPKSDGEYADQVAANDSRLMVENLLEAGRSHIVFPSSMTVYTADTPLPVREHDAAPAPPGYAGGKKAAEDLLLAAHGTCATVLRLPGLFGPPRRSGMLYNAATAYAAGGEPRLPAQAPLWAGLHVDDAALLCARAALRPPGESLVLNAGYAQRMSLCSAVRVLACLFGRRPPAFDGPDFEMDLSRLQRTLGLPAKGFTARLEELAAWARAEVEARAMPATGHA